MKKIIFCFLLIVPFVSSLWAESTIDLAVASKTDLTVHGITIIAEVANTDATRAQGLMYRKELGPNNGMLFVFPNSDVRNFWMKNTTIPLSIAFMDSHGVILNIVDEMKPLTETLYTSQGKAQFGLEMNSDWFNAQGIKPGDKIPDVLKAPPDPTKDLEKFIYPAPYSSPVLIGTPLGVRVYQNGGIVVKDGEKVVAMIEGDFSFPGDKIDKHIHFDEGHSQSLSELESTADVGDGSKASLTGFLKKRANGFEVEYDLTPSQNFNVHMVDAYVRLNYADWLGSDCQVGSDRRKITSHDFGAYKSYLQCLAFIGPSKAYPRLCMEINGKDAMGISASDNRFIHQPCLAFRLEPDKTPARLWQWKANDRKELSFTISFNRPVSVSDQIYPEKEFEDIRTSMLEKTFTATSPAMAPTVSPQPNMTLEPDYPIPADAKKVHYYFDCKGGYHLFVPAEFSVSGKIYKGCLNFDTGITTDNGDINITHDFFNRLSFKNAQKINVAESVINSVAGGFSHKDNDEYVSSSEGKPPGMADEIKVKIGDMEIDNPVLFTSQSLEDAYLHFSDNNVAFYKEYPVAGAVPFQLIRKYLISIDYKNSEIYFRPLTSKRRTFFEKKPLKVFKGIVLGQGLYLPVEINQSIRGLASMDTGCPVFLLDSDVVDVSCFPIKSYWVGGYDVTEKLQETKPTLFNNLRYQCFIGNIGNDFFENSFITIDPREQKIYEEEIP